jgi:EmrB/QacA subfamily drug resistance transporter
VVSVAQFMVILDASITNVALPSIGRGLHVSQGDLQWVVNIYVLMFGGFLLLGGRAGDLFGRRRMFVGGLTLFSLASLAGGFSQSITWLVAARGVQGLGAAIISPVALAIVSSTFAEGPERNKALGIFGSLAGAGGATGVLLGGILTTFLGWQWVLFVNVPIGLAAASIAPRIVPRDVLPKTRAGFDLPGALLITSALISLVYGVVKAPANGWTSVATLAFFSLAAVLLTLFVITELRTAHPLVRLGIFRTRNLVVADLSGMLSGAGMFAMFFFLSLYMQIVLHYSALEAGARYLPLAVTIAISAAITSQLVTRFGYKYVMVAGMTLVASGLVLLTRITTSDSYGSEVLPALIVFSIGMGMTFVPLQIASVSGVRAAEIGLASGLINACVQIGGALGLAVLSTISTTEFNGVMAALHSPAAYPTAMIDGFRHAIGAGAVLLTAGALLVLVALPQGGTRGREVETDSAVAPLEALALATGDDAA